MDGYNDIGLPAAASREVRDDRAEESRALASLALPLRLAPRVWIPAAAEEAFYRLNHLDARLLDMFGDTVGPDPDEDDIEEIAPEVRRLVADHVVLDLWVDAFYDACRPLGPRLRIRRPGDVGSVAANGRPALLALRAAWAAPWSDEAIVARLRSGGDLRAASRPLVVHAVDRAAETELTDAVQRQVGSGWRPYVDSDGEVTRLEASNLHS